MVFEFLQKLVKNLLILMLYKWKIHLIKLLLFVQLCNINKKIMILIAEMREGLSFESYSFAWIQHPCSRRLRARRDISQRDNSER